MKGKVGNDGLAIYHFSFAVYLISFGCEFDIMFISGMQIKS